MIESFQMEPSSSRPVVNITANPQHRLLLPTTLEAAYATIPVKCTEATVPDQIVPTTTFSLASNQVVATDIEPPLAALPLQPRVPYPVNTINDLNESWPQSPTQVADFWHVASLGMQ